MRIGIDFDNTLVSYDRAFALVGMEEGLLPADFVGYLRWTLIGVIHNGNLGLSFRGSAWFPHPASPQAPKLGSFCRFTTCNCI
jgi:hypothetical protein